MILLVTVAKVVEIIAQMIFDMEENKTHRVIDGLKAEGSDIAFEGTEKQCKEFVDTRAYRYYSIHPIRSEASINHEKMVEKQEEKELTFDLSFAAGTYTLEGARELSKRIQKMINDAVKNRTESQTRPPEMYSIQAILWELMNKSLVSKQISIYSVYELGQIFGVERLKDVFKFFQILYQTKNYAEGKFEILLQYCEDDIEHTNPEAFEKDDIDEFLNTGEIFNPITGNECDKNQIKNCLIYYLKI